LYILLVDHILPPRDHKETLVGAVQGQSASRPHTPVPSSAFGHGTAGYYFGENGEHVLSSVSEAIGQTMVDMGKSDDPTPTPFSDEEYKKYYPNGTSLGSNSRCRSDRSRHIGWKPTKTTRDMLNSIKKEFEYVLYKD